MMASSMPSPLQAEHPGVLPRRRVEVDADREGGGVAGAAP